MDMGALLSMVLSCSGMSVPLWSIAECMRKGGSSGMACSVLSLVVTGEFRVNMSSVVPTVLVYSTENLLVRQGMDFTVDWPKNLFGPFYLLCCISGIHCCCNCFGYKAFDVDLIRLGQVNPLLSRFQAVMLEVAFLITVIAGAGLLFALALINVHGC